MGNREFLASLEKGEIRVVERDGNEWKVNLRIKEEILEVFKNSKITKFADNFIDKDLLSPRIFEIEDKVRIVPGGTSVRPGCYIGKNVVIMPPSFINIGAYVDDDTMIDSHVLVGSCAQLGKKIHLSAGVQIGGVLEPIGNRPVIIEDNCFIGAGAVIVEGILVRKNAVIAPGVVLSASMPIYDVVNEKIYKGEIPENAVVVSGSRALSKNNWSRENNLNLSCAIIIKYRDEKTDSSLILEDILRE